VSPRVVVITGASRGIGAATAERLAAPGTTLVLAARDTAALGTVASAIERAGGAALPVGCDVTDEAQVVTLMGRAAAVTGQIDALICAAGQAVIGPVGDLPLATWERVIGSSLTGTFLACREALPAIPRGGAVVTVASVAARQAFPGWAAYCAAKAGQLALMAALREELRPRGVRVAAVLPAATDTALWDSLPGAWNRGAMLAPADVAGAIAWLLAQPPEVAIEELTVGHVSGRL
jgi:NADP-dependent 3-hydroxy acid dehydrogenase YdfG